ncbi:MAG: heparinase II/III family protein, partial [Alphaproteobacteria bacterium]
MTIQAIRQLKHKLAPPAKNNFLYNLSLNSWPLGASTADSLLIKPPDPWAGNSLAGEELLQGCFTHKSERFHFHGGQWKPLGINHFWLKKLHSFQWLRDLRAIGGAQGRQTAKAYIQHWIHHNHHYDSDIWAPDITGLRLSMWISHYDFFSDADDDEFQDDFFASLHKQARHLGNSLSGELYGLKAFQALKGYLYTALALPGREKDIERALNTIQKHIKTQILGDGGHISRNPETLLQILIIMLDMRHAFAAAGYPLPDFIQHAIDRAGPALRFFIYGDKNLGIFNGSNEQDIAVIDSVLAQAGVRGKILSSLPSCGYERVSQGRTLLVFDTGQSPPWPYDKAMHAAPLSFEMAYGKERIFSTCGAHLTCDEWNASLRATAAHNTVTIDHRNAAEIRQDGHLGRKVHHPFIRREENRKTCLIEASHDGYLPLNGITHSRRLFLGEQGSDLRGEDTLDCLGAPSRPLDIAIRFHLHPRVLVSLVQNETEALL